MPSLFRTRIAPTPSGFLHLGNVFNFLLTETIIRQKKGSLQLRIDDLDAQRIRADYLYDIFETLDWLGISIDYGSKNSIEQQSIYAQQFHLNDYQKLLNKLVATGQVFACNCSRKDWGLLSQDGQYPGTCRYKKIPLKTPDVAWRFRTDDDTIVNWEDGILNTQNFSLFRVNKDFIIRRRDGLPAYHIASLSDDVRQNINITVRGEDLLFSTAAQLHLAKILGLESILNCTFYHHPLIRNEAGEKLSKSAGAFSVKALREKGLAPSAIREMAHKWHQKFLPEML